jgi:hypothetical protein
VAWPLSCPTAATEVADVLAPDVALDVGPDVDPKAPLVLVDNVFVDFIRQDADYIYFGNNFPPGVGRVPKVGGKTESYAAEEPMDLAVDDAYVYWSAVGNVQRAPKTGGPPQSLTKTATGAAWAFALDATNLYFSDNVDTIWKVPKTGSGSAQKLITLSGQPVGAALDGTDLYVSIWSPGAIVRTDTSGTTPKVLANIEYSNVIVVDASGVYWTAEQSGVFSVDKAGTNPPFTYAIPSSAEGLATDATNVYWADLSIGVSRSPKSSATPELFDDKYGSRSVVVDDNYVYYTTNHNNTGQIIRRGK